MHLTQIVVVFFFAALYSCNGYSEKCEDLTRHKNWRLLDQGDKCGKSVDRLIKPRLLGGKPAGRGEFPWMVHLRVNIEVIIIPLRTASCGGVLINKRYVLTAAHCVVKAVAPEHVTVVLGEHDTRTPEDCGGGKPCSTSLPVKVEEVRVHKDYHDNQTITHNDIALLRLKQDVKFTDQILPICLPTSCSMRNNNFIGEKMTVAGWGQDGKGNRQNILHKTEVEVYAEEFCERGYHGFPGYWATKICAGRLKGTDSCSGDSGGPLMYKDKKSDGRIYAVGIASFGDHCTIKVQNRPGAYTRVSSYLPWILDNMRP